MPINFPSSPSNNQLFVTEGKAMRYNATKNRWKAVSTLSSSQITDLEARTIGVSSMSISGNTLVIQKDDSSYANVSLASFAGNKLTTYANASILPLNDLVSGTQVYVEDTDSLYITDGSGWYKIATVNLSPSLTLGVSSISLGPGGSVDVNYTVNEPEDTPYTVTASSTSNATITIYQANNTITFNSPVQNTTETITITATDGINSVGDTLTMTVALLISNSKYTTLLATAVDTSNNSTITDSSSNARSVTIAGSPDVGTFSPYRQGGYSVRFGDDSYDRILIQDSINIGQDFTMEAWIYPDIVNDQQGQIINQDDFFESGMIFQLKVYGNGGIHFPFWQNNLRSSVVSLLIPDVLTSGKWQHIVVRRISFTNELRIFVDGVSVYSNSSYSFYSTGRPFAIGNSINRISSGYTNINHRDEFIGYIADVRVSNTSSIYTGTSFTPPTERLTASSSTLLLACNDQFPFFNYKTASGTSTNIDLGQTGSTTNSMKSAPAGPYDHSGYSASDNGGSIKFDGSSDYLQVNNSTDFAFGTGDFTIEAWVNYTTWSGSGGQAIIGTSTSTSTGAAGQWYLTAYGATDLRFGRHGAAQYTSVNPGLSVNSWNHIAVTREGTTLRIFVNGVSLTTSDTGGGMGSYDISNSSGYLYIGEGASFSAASGYISDVRIIKGTASYTSDFTLPTSPLSSSGATLHIKGTDASIIDKAQSTNLVIAGNPTGSTVQTKFAGTKSIYFDGNGDSLSITPDYKFGTADWTIEAWVYTVSSSQQAITYIAGNASYYGLRFEINGGGNRRLQVLLSSDGSTLDMNYTATTGGVSLNTWTHVACVRNGSDILLFENGNQVGTTQSFSGSLYNGSLNQIGVISNLNYFNGYLSDLRITKGLARYTSNFTPPTSSLEG